MGSRMIIKAMNTRASNSWNLGFESDTSEFLMDFAGAYHRKSESGGWSRVYD